MTTGMDVAILAFFTVATEFDAGFAGDVAEALADAVWVAGDVCMGAMAMARNAVKIKLGILMPLSVKELWNLRNRTMVTAASCQKKIM